MTAENEQITYRHPFTCVMSFVTAPVIPFINFHETTRPRCMDFREMLYWVFLTSVCRENSTFW
jgi:hypothetical protein